MATDPGLRRLALGTLLGAFPGERPPAWATDLLAEGIAGFVLFGYNVFSPEQLAGLTAALPGALIGIDEEGGDVTRLAHLVGSPYPGNAALGANGDVATTREVYRTIGAELRAVGVNLNLAPTVDVNTSDDNPIIGTRSFGASPGLVAAHASAAVEGLQGAGVAACVKHFPGHGATLADSHLELPTVDVSLDVLRSRELPPFVAAIEAGARSLMTAHIRVPSVTGDAPATFSRAVLVDLLREDLGFDGAVITDALEMRGAVNYAGSVPAGAVLALAAGADLLCIGAEVDAALTYECADAIVSAVDDGVLALSRLESACSRASSLSSWVSSSQAPPGVPGGGSDLGYLAALGAVRVEGSLPSGPPLVVQLDSEASLAVGRVPWGLGPHLNGTELLRVVPSTPPASILATAGGRPLVIVGRNIHRLAGAPDLLAALVGSADVVVVEMGWPSSWRPAGVRAFVTTWGASYANGRAAASALALA